MHSQIVIVGAGVIGLAIGKQLSESGFEVTIIEKWPHFGEEISSRNSEVIHAGIYYPENSLKAKFCVSGNASLYDFANKYNIPHKQCGKLIIAQNESQITEIDAIYKHAQKLGARDLSILDKKQIQNIEPNLKADAAIFSPSSGIIDSHAFMSVLEARILNGGSQIIYNHEIIDIDKTDNWNLTIKNHEDIFQLSSDRIINCAGLYSDNISKLAGINDYELTWAKGSYFRLSPKLDHLTNRLIYPVPEPNTSGLGIHITPDISGSLRLGPDVEFLSDKDLDYNVDPIKTDKFFKAAKSYFPSINKDNIYPDYAGIRPKIQRKNETQKDFVIRHEIDKGCPGLINLIGIESPGLTASLEIAKFVTKLIDDL